MLRYFIIISIAVFVTSCNENINNFNRLEGNWEDKNVEGKFVENWKLINDTLISGSSYMIQSNDTIFSEKIKLVSRGGKIYYIPAVSDQNDGKGIEFCLLSRKSNKWVFENKKHDFPTRIMYEFKGKDSLIVNVDGKENGKYQKYTFNLKKS